MQRNFDFSMLAKAGLFVALFLCVSGIARAANFTWVGPDTGNGVWTATGNWTGGNPNNYPWVGDTAIVSTGKVEVNTGTVYYNSAFNRNLYQLNSNVKLSGTGNIASYAPTPAGIPYGFEVGTLATLPGNTLTFEQSGGMVTSNYLALGTDRAASGATINVNYKMTGGTLYPSLTILAEGANVRTVMDISSNNDPRSADYTYILYTGMIVGAGGGKGTINMSGGFLTGALDYMGDYGNQGLTLGVSGGTGTMNFSGNARSVYSSAMALYTVGGNKNNDSTQGGTGVANHGGNSYFETYNLVVGESGGTGTVNISTGTLLARFSAIIGTGKGNATINQTCGGLFQVGPYQQLAHYGVNEEASGGIIAHNTPGPSSSNANMYLGYNLDSGGVAAGSKSAGQAVYNMPCGNYLCYGDTYVGWMSAPGTNFNDTLAQWNISKNANVTINKTSANSIDGNLNIGFVQSYTDGTTSTLTNSEVNIYGGKISVENSIIGYSANAHLNIYGSKADINTTFMTVSGSGKRLDINYMLDSYGASAIKAELISLEAETQSLDINTPGFISLKTDTTTLMTASKTAIGAQGYNWANLWLDNTPFQFKDVSPANHQSAVIQINHEGINLINTPWDGIVGVYEIFRTDDPLRVNGTVSGALELHGEYTYIQAFFKGVEGKTGVDGTPLIDLLMNYLNSAVVETGVHFGALTADSLLLTGPYLNDSGYAWFGWDLGGFNAVYGLTGSDGVTLYQLNAVPEPATWIMLLLAGPAVFFFRRRVR